MSSSRPGLLSRNLVFYLFSRFCGGTALTMLRAAILWHVFALTNSAFHLGLIGLVQFLPALGLNLLGGAVADSYQRRRVIMLAQLVPFACALALFALTRSGSISVPWLYAMVFVIACASSFRGARRALPELVPRDPFARAVTLASTGQALAFMSGPAGGGFIIAEFGISTTYASTASDRGIPCGLRSWTDAAGRNGHYHQLVILARGCSCAPQSGRGLHVGRHAGGDLRRCHGAAADLRDRFQVGARGYGILSASLEAGAAVVDGTGGAPTGAPHRACPVDRGRRIRLGDDRLRPLALVSAVGGVLHAGRHGRPVSVVMRSPPSTGDAGRPARPGELGELIFIGASNQLGAAESGFLAALTRQPSR
jgi:hypothetical protein